MDFESVLAEEHCRSTTKVENIIAAIDDELFASCSFPDRNNKNQKGKCTEEKSTDIDTSRYNTLDNNQSEGVHALDLREHIRSQQIWTQRKPECSEWTSHFPYLRVCGKGIFPNYKYCDNSTSAEALQNLQNETEFRKDERGSKISRNLSLSNTCSTQTSFTPVTTINEQKSVDNLLIKGKSMKIYQGKDLTTPLCDSVELDEEIFRIDGILEEVFDIHRALPDKTDDEVEETRRNRIRNYRELAGFPPLTADRAILDEAIQNAVVETYRTLIPLLASALLHIID